MEQKNRENRTNQQTQVSDGKDIGVEVSYDLKLVKTFFRYEDTEAHKEKNKHYRPRKTKYIFANFRSGKDNNRQN